MPYLSYLQIRQWTRGTALRLRVLDMRLRTGIKLKLIQHKYTLEDVRPFPVSQVKGCVRVGVQS